MGYRSASPRYVRSDLFVVIAAHLALLRRFIAAPRELCGMSTVYTVYFEDDVNDVVLVRPSTMDPSHLCTGRDLMNACSNMLVGTTLQVYK